MSFRLHPPIPVFCAHLLFLPAACAVVCLVAILVIAGLGASEAAGGLSHASRALATSSQGSKLVAAQPARLQQLDEEEDEGEDEEGEDEAPTPAVPVVPVADNYEAATNADDLITKALEHGTLSAAQAKAILAAAKAAARIALACAADRVPCSRALVIKSSAFVAAS